MTIKTLPELLADDALPLLVDPIVTGGQEGKQTDREPIVGGFNSYI